MEIDWDTSTKGSDVATSGGRVGAAYLLAVGVGGRDAQEEEEEEGGRGGRAGESVWADGERRKGEEGVVILMLCSCNKISEMCDVVLRRKMQDCIDLILLKRDTHTCGIYFGR